MLVNTEIKDRICYIEMQNAGHFNCLSEAMCQELCDAIQSGYDQECVGIVIKAQCSKGVWSAGHDIRELPQNGEDPLAYDVPMERLLRCVQETAIPVIACVNGTVWGGACDLCLSCDMIVSTNNATFAITPAKIGIPYNASGIMHFINQLGINKAREMFFLATPITANDAMNVGLINRVASPEDIDNVLEEQFLNPLPPTAPRCIRVPTIWRASAHSWRNARRNIKERHLIWILIRLNNDEAKKPYRTDS